MFDSGTETNDLYPLSTEVTSFDWIVFFNTLIPNFPPDVKINITEDQISLEGKLEKIEFIQQQLQQRLLDPESFFKGLPYSIELPPSSQAIRFQLKELIQIALPAPNDLKHGKKIIENLFGRNALDELALNLELLFPNDIANAENGVIYSKFAGNEKIARAWNANFEALLAQFNGVDLHRLRQAYLDFNNPLPPLQNELDDSSINTAAGAAKQCFGVQKTDKGWRAFFDYIRMHQLLFPPVLTLSALTQQDNPVKLIFSRSHFMNYFQQISQGGVLLRLYCEGKDILARPIITTHKQAIDKPKHFVFIIDKSGSMQPEFPTLRIHLLKHIIELASRYSEATVRLVFFNSVSEARTFHLKNIKEIEAFIYSQSADDATRLIGAVDDELQQLLIETKTISYQVNILLFTDGKNNRAPENVSILDTQLGKFKVKPLIFCIGAGNEYDHTLLGNLTKAVGGKLFHISNINQFSIITNEIPTMHFVRKFFELLINEQAYSIPLPLNNGPHVTEILVPFTETPLIVNSLKISPSSDLTISAASSIDKILKLRGEYYEIVKQDDEKTLPFIKAISKLELIQQSLLEITPPQQISSQPYEIINQLQTEIKATLDTLRLQDSQQAAKMIHAISSQFNRLQLTHTTPEVTNTNNPSMSI